MAPKVLVRRLDRMVKLLNEAFLLPCRHVALCCEGGVGNILKQKFLAGVVRKKLGLNLVSEETDKGRVYRIKDSKASSGAADRVKQAA